MRERFAPLTVAVGLVVFAPVVCAAESGRLPVSGRSVAARDLVPADVLARIRLLSAELDLLRAELGAPAMEAPTVVVTGAIPRDVWIQAKALFRNADELAYEWTGARHKPPRLADTAEVVPTDVWRMVDAALASVLAVKSHHGITERIEEEPEADEALPSGVYAAVWGLNRRLEPLLERGVTAADVYQQVTLAVHYGGALLALFPDTTRFPADPPLERRRSMRDVHLDLLSALGQLRASTERSGMQAKRIRFENMQRIGADEAYDLAGQVVAELSVLLARAKPGMRVPLAYPPGRKTPSQVRQRIGVLMRQLEQLEAAIVREPRWLEGR